MERVCDYELCTGCGLCASNCPKGSISMSKRDSFGHLYPIINTGTCIDCGLCQKNCPILNPSELMMPSVAYAAWSKDEENYISSTSGGAASVISQYVIEKVARTSVRVELASEFRYRSLKFFSTGI